VTPTRGPQIQAWLNSGSSSPLNMTYSFPYNIGVTLPRGVVIQRVFTALIEAAKVA
jgi:hypothetical protein